MPERFLNWYNYCGKVLFAPPFRSKGIIFENTFPFLVRDSVRISSSRIVHKLTSTASNVRGKTRAGGVRDLLARGHLASSTKRFKIEIEVVFLRLNGEKVKI